VRTLASLLIGILAVGLAPAARAQTAAPSCVGAWTIDEPAPERGSLVDVEVAPDGTVVAFGWRDTGPMVVRRAVDGTWDELAVPDTDGTYLLEGLVVHSPDDIEVVANRWDRSVRGFRLSVARFDGTSWTSDPGIPDQEWFVGEVVHRGEDLAISGSHERRRRPTRLGVVIRRGGAWSWIHLDQVLDQPMPGAELRIGGIDLGARGDLWIVGHWRDVERSAFIARMDPSGRWRQRPLRGLDRPRDVDLADGWSAITGVRRDAGVVLIGRPGDRHRVQLPSPWMDEVDMRSPTDIWVSDDVHVDGHDATWFAPRRRPDAGRDVADTAFAADGSVWSVGSTTSRRDRVPTVEHLCPWEVGGPLEPRLVRTTGSATGVIWRVPDDASGPAILVDRSPFRLFDEVLQPGASMSFAYPGVGRYRFREVTTGRTGVVAVALLAYRRPTSTPSVWLDFGYPFEDTYAAEIHVQGPDDTGYRQAFLPDRYSSGRSWIVDQGSGTYRFRGRMIAPDGTVGEWSPVSTVTIP